MSSSLQVVEDTNGNDSVLQVSNVAAGVNVGRLLINGETGPGAPTAAALSGGSVPVGDYCYRVTFVTAAGETEGGLVSNNVALSGSNRTTRLTSVPTGTAGVVTDRRVYRRCVGAALPGTCSHSSWPADKKTINCSTAHGLAVGDALRLPCGPSGATRWDRVALAATTTQFAIENDADTQLSSANGTRLTSPNSALPGTCTHNNWPTDKKTINCSAAHGLAVGDNVQLPGATGGAMLWYQVATVPTTTQFVITIDTAVQLSSASGNLMHPGNFTDYQYRLVGNLGNNTSTQFDDTSTSPGVTCPEFNATRQLGIGTTSPQAPIHIQAGTDGATTGLTGDAPALDVEVYSSNRNASAWQGPDLFPWAWGARVRSKLESGMERCYGGIYSVIEDFAVGTGDHIGVVSIVDSQANAVSPDRGTGGDLWAYWGLVCNYGHSGSMICMELNPRNTWANCADQSSAQTLRGLVVWSELSTRHCTTGAHIAGNASTKVGFGVGARIEQFVDYGIHLESNIEWRDPPANSQAANPAGIRFQSNLNRLLCICKDANVDYWRLDRAASGNALVWRSNVGATPVDALAIDQNGRLGAGTTTPAQTLHLYNPADTTNSLIIDCKGDSGAQQSTINLLTVGNGAADVGSGSTKGWTIFARGNACSVAAEQNDLGISFWNGSAYTSALWLDYTGKVGMGTTSPNEKLQVVGNIAVGPASGTGTYLAGRILATTHQAGDVPSSTQLGLKDAPAGTFAGMSVDGVRDGSYNSYSLSFATHHGMVSAGTRMTIDKDGKVGIGTTSPGRRLEICREGNNTEFTLGGHLFLDGQGSNVRITNNAYFNSAGSWANADGTNRAVTIEMRDTGVVDIYGVVTAGATDWRQMVNVDAPNNKVCFPNGNVGVGTTSPAEKLEVAGRIRANTCFNINGTNGWSGTFTVKVSGVDKTCTVNGGIITNVA